MLRMSRRILLVLAVPIAALALAGGATAAGAPTTPDLHPLASPRAAGWTTLSWSPSSFPAGATGRWYELAVDSFFGPGESLSDHVVYTATGTDPDDLHAAWPPLLDPGARRGRVRAVDDPVRCRRDRLPDGLATDRRPAARTRRSSAAERGSTHA